MSLCLRFVDLIHLRRIRRVLNFIIACANNKRHSSAECKCELAFATTVIYILFDFFFLLSHAHYLMPLFNAQPVSLSVKGKADTGSVCLSNLFVCSRNVCSITFTTPTTDNKLMAKCCYIFTFLFHFVLFTMK